MKTQKGGLKIPYRLYTKEQSLEKKLWRWFSAKWYWIKESDCARFELFVSGLAQVRRDSVLVQKMDMGKERNDAQRLLNALRKDVDKLASDLGGGPKERSQIDDSENDDGLSGLIGG